MISDRAIFIHIPRCGGTSVETVFDDIRGHHQSWRWYERAFPALWHDPTVLRFAFVRDPFERLESLWAYWNNVNRAEWYGAFNAEQQTKDRQQALFRANVFTFDGMLAAIPQLRASVWTHGHFQTQFSYIDHSQIRTYNISTGEVATAWRGICERANLPQETALPWMNRAPERAIEWTPKRRQMVLRYFTDDLRYVTAK